jgi:hypothetical protein
MEFESPQTHDPTNIDPFSTKVLYIPDVARLLRKDPKTIQRMSTRKRNRLPLVRGMGKPFILERDLFAWVQAQGRPIVNGYL